jgi:arginine exporter protein ArgO
MKDFRAIIGVFFALLGVLLLGAGALQPELRAPLAQTNVNLWSGVMMFGFGGVLLWFSRRRA